jgi:murein DD-endopeptidase MepM/ murein hydrolase activator NlpD
LADGYYGWKENRLTQITFESGETRPLEVSLNPGSVALRVLFAHLLPPTEWESAIIQFPALYTELFGDPWGRAASIEPLTPPGLKQPELILPFEFGATWSLTAGPHPVWALSAPWGALDFAPSSSETGCIESNAWVLAAAPGVITRVGNGILALDLDFDRKEQTGWVLLYMHLRANADLQPGSTVQTEERLGHPSCDGGFTTGTHIHLARKYNGEWLPADGSLPFVLGGWTAHSSGVAYQGTLTNGSQTVTSSMYSTHDSQIVRSQPSAP